MRAIANPRPVIVIGMHRSGTSLIARMLEGLGLFMGDRKEENNEALFFLHLNEWLLSQAGCRWDNPAPFDQLLAVPELRERAIRGIGTVFDSAHLRTYLGGGAYRRFRTRGAFPEPWGWKDPRNTFTLPLWLELFPQARVVHVYRHGTDVAKSLAVRGRRYLETRPPTIRGRPFWRRRVRLSQLAESPRCLSLEGGVALWVEYLDRARKHREALGERFVEVRYEDFLAEPARHLAGLAGWLGLESDARRVDRLTRAVNPSRAYSYRTDPRLVAFSEAIAPTLAAWNY